ncbi:MAG: hypothetical protein ACYC55_05150 [Candidatus Geothermincolia bacterium]
MSRWKRWLARLKPRRILCDRCAYDYPSACRRPERPNARSCPDYRRRY